MQSRVANKESENNDNHQKPRGKNPHPTFLFDCFPKRNHKTKNGAGHINPVSQKGVVQEKLFYVDLKQMPAADNPHRISLIVRISQISFQIRHHKWRYDEAYYQHIYSYNFRLKLPDKLSAKQKIYED